MSVDSSSAGGFAAKFAKKNPAIDTSKSDGMTASQRILEKKEQKTTGESLMDSNKSAASSVPPEKASKADLIYLVKGVDDNRNAWYYVLVERLKLSLFLKALNDDIIHLENYGVILYSAYGDEPPQEITDKLKIEYGIK